MEKITKINVGGTDYELGGSGGSGGGFIVHEMNPEDEGGGLIGTDFSDCFENPANAVNHVFVYYEDESVEEVGGTMLLVHKFVPDGIFIGRKESGLDNNLIVFQNDIIGAIECHVDDSYIAMEVIIM